MYAIIRTSGKQYRIEPGTVLELDRLEGEPGKILTLDGNVLLVSDDTGLKVGTPVVSGAAVDLEVMGHFRGEKLVVFKMKRRKRNRCKNGHRQELTRVRVKDIRAA